MAWINEEALCKTLASSIFYRLPLVLIELSLEGIFDRQIKAQNNDSRDDGKLAFFFSSNKT